MTTVTVGIPPFIPFLLIFILWIYIFVLYIRRKDGTKCTYNPYATGHIGQRGLGTLRANSSPRAWVPYWQGAHDQGWGGGGARWGPPRSGSDRWMVGRRPPLGLPPLKIDFGVSRQAQSNGGVATSRCLTPAGLREGKGR